MVRSPVLGQYFSLTKVNLQVETHNLHFNWACLLSFCIWDNILDNQAFEISK